MARNETPAGAGAESAGTPPAGTPPAGTPTAMNTPPPPDDAALTTMGTGQQPGSRPPPGAVTWDRPLDPLRAAEMEKNHVGTPLIWVRSNRTDDRIAVWEPSLEHPGGQAWIAGERPERVALTATIRGLLRDQTIVEVGAEEARTYYQRVAESQFRSTRMEDLEAELDRLKQAVRSERDRLAMAQPMVSPTQSVPTG